MNMRSFTDYFVSGCKAESDLQVGVEWEKIGISRETGQAIPYSGPRGVRAIFEALEERYQWVPIRASTGEPIALKKGPVNITLEPGGQIELSGQKARSLEDNAAELYLHLTEIRQVSEPLGIAWLGLGAQPFSTQEGIEWVPKERYSVMRGNLKDRGELTYAMMKETASVQVSLDYTSPEDAVEKLRLAMALTPLFIALFANSPLERGAPSPYLSRRAHIWSLTDPDRSGILWEAFDPAFSLEDYTRFAMDVPMLFLQRKGQWISVPRIRFSDFLKDGWKDYEAEPDDWDLHLTSIFTEARLKKYVEIRSIDCQSAPMGMAAVAFVKGLFYGKDARDTAWEMLKGLTLDERKQLHAAAPRTALSTPFRGGTLRHLAEALIELAPLGLAAEERRFLEPLRRMIVEKRCPAQKLLQCFEDAPSLKSKIDRILLCAAI
jgi:glutamate--cysteine ligase